MKKHFPVKFKGFITFFLVLHFTAIPIFASDNTPVLNLVVTSDLHGWMSSSYIYPERKHKGLFHIAEKIRKFRKKDPSAILIDAGDLLQGSPLQFFYDHIAEDQEESPFLSLFNSLSYDAVVVGNHDMSIGSVLEQNNRLLDTIPWLAANITKNGDSLFTPYFALNRGGIKVILIGFTTSATQLWFDHKSNDVDFTSTHEASKKWLKLIKKTLDYDIIIGIFHAGTNRLRDDENLKLSRINQEKGIKDILEKNPGFDLIISGHDHNLNPNRRNKTVWFNKGVPIVSPGSHGEAALFLSLILKKNKDRFEIQKIESKVEIAVRSKSLADAYKKNLPRPYLNYINEALPWIAESTDIEKSRRCVNILYSEAVKDNNITGSLLPYINLPYFEKFDGKRVLRSSLFRWYKYDNKSVTVSLNRNEISLLKTPLPEHGKYYLPYNRKLFSNLDLRFPIKQSSIVKPLEDYKHLFPVEISDYHFYGGAGIIAALHLSSDRLVAKSSEFIRERVFKFLKSTKDLPQDCFMMKFSPI